MAISTLITDYWRITNLFVNPTSIVGGGNDFQGIAQSLYITPVINVGLSTTIRVTSSLPSLISTQNISFSTALNLNISDATTGFATGFSTTFPTTFSITAFGPGNSSLTVGNLILNPFLFSSGVGTALWPSGITTIPSYQFAGIGATSIVTLNLNAYVPAAGLRTALVSSFNPNLFIYTGSGTAPINNGIVTFLQNTNSQTISIGHLPFTRNQGISTNVTFRLLNSTGIVTASLSFSGLTDYAFLYGPIVKNTNNLIQLRTVSQFALPMAFQVGLGSTLSISKFASFSTTLNTLSTSSSWLNTFDFTTFPDKDSRVGVFVTNVNGITSQTQTYYAYYYSSEIGYPKAMGFDYFGELTKNFINFTSFQPSGVGANLGVGTQSKIPMFDVSSSAISNFVKTASGKNHNLGLDINGNVFVTGDNHYGQLSLNTIGFTTNLFTKIAIATAVDIFANNNSSYVLTYDNTLYSFGQNNLNQLGFASNGLAFTSTITKVIDNVHLFSVYNNYGYVVTYNNPYDYKLGIWSFGAIATSTADNSFGCLNGITSFNLASSFSLNGVNRSISSAFIHKIDVGFNHVLALATWTDVATGLGSTGVIAWGYNSLMQLGTSIPSVGFVTTPNILMRSNLQSLNIDYPVLGDPEKTLIVANNQYSLVALNTSGISSTFYYGPSSENYYGGWIPYTSITTSIGIAQPFLNETLYKVAKTKDHLVWVTNFGSAYVTGFSENFNLKNVDYYSISQSFSFIENASLGISETQARFSYLSSGVYNIFYNDALATGLQTSNISIKRATTAANKNKPLTSSDIIGLLFNDEIQAWVYTNSGNSNLSRMDVEWTSIISSNFTVSDIAIGRSYLSESSFIIPFFVSAYHKQESTYNNNIYNFLFGFSTSGQYLGLIGTNFVTSENASYITKLASGMYESRNNKLTLGLTTYDWYSSNNNIIAGFNDGSFTVYSDANLGSGDYFIFTHTSLIQTAQIMSASTSPIVEMKAIFSTKLNSNVLVLSQSDRTLSVFSFGTTFQSGGNGFEGGLKLENSSIVSSTYGAVNNFMGQFYSLSDYVIVTTKNNYIGLIKLDSSSVFLNQYSQLLAGGNVKSVFNTDASSKNKVASNNSSFIITDQNIIQKWYVPLNSFEIGLNYWNTTASPKLMTRDGSATGVGISFINGASTNEDFTVIIDNNSTTYL
jgi:alpha-tubulin suppressor-like RCC1 family protein